MCLCIGLNNAGKYCDTSIYRRCRFWQKNHIFRWSSFWSWRVCKQEKLSHLGHRKPARNIENPMNPKRVSVWCGFWYKGIIGPFFFENEQGEAVAIVIVIFCSQKLKRRILATFGFNRTALRATQPNLYLMFCSLFLKIALSAAELISFGHLGAGIWHRWTIICGLPSKISVTPTVTIDALKDNIREAIDAAQNR